MIINFIKRRNYIIDFSFIIIDLIYIKKNNVINFLFMIVDHMRRNYVINFLFMIIDLIC